MSPSRRRRSVDVSVVVPVLNEEATLPQLVERTVATCEAAGFSWEFILVDDGSRDRSAELIAEATTTHDGAVRAVILIRNYGQHAAVMAGLSASIGDIVITLDADLQNPPEEIPRLVEKLQSGYDVVGCVRENRHDSPFRRIASRMVNRVISRLTGAAIGDFGCMLRGYRRYVVDAMLRCPEKSTFIPVLANMFARNIAEIPVAHAPRVNGESRYGVWKLINLQFDLLTCVSTLPLQLLAVIGVIVSAGAFVFGALLIVMRLVFGAEWAADGVFTLFAILFLFVGAQFVGMGILGEYLGRIYIDVRARPKWLVRAILPEEDVQSGVDGIAQPRYGGVTIDVMNCAEKESRCP